MDFINKGFNFDYSVSDNQVKEAEKNKKKVMRKLNVAFFLFLIISILNYYFISNNGGRFFSFQARIIFAGVVLLIFIITYVLLMIHLNGQIKLKHYLKFYQFYDIIQFLLIVATIIAFTQMFIVRIGTVEGSSMESTLHNGDNVLILQVINDLKRNDIVVVNPAFYDDYKGKDSTHIKKIRALPNDKIALVEVGINKYEIQINEVSIKNNNNEVIILDETNQKDKDHIDNLEVLISEVSGIIPLDKYLLIGDNFRDSADSRIYGLMDGKGILGLVNFRLTKEFGWIK